MALPGRRDREELEAGARRDVFEPAVEALHGLFNFILAERRDLFVGLGQRIELALEQLDEIVLIWHRIADDSIELIEAVHERSEVVGGLGLTSYSVGAGTYPELDAVCAWEEKARTALWLDYKSLFVFADVLLGVYAQVSELIWDAPEDVEHHHGLSFFVGSVERLPSPVDPASEFGASMTDLLPTLKAIDLLLGFYRDKFIIHPRVDLPVTSSGSSLSAPLLFHRSHSRLVHPTNTDAEVLLLKKAMDQVAKRENTVSHADPRDTLRDLATRLDSLKHDSSIQTVQNQLKAWGMTSPQVIDVARRLNAVFATWATRLTEVLAAQPRAERASESQAD